MKCRVCNKPFERHNVADIARCLANGFSAEFGDAVNIVAASKIAREATQIQSQIVVTLLDGTQYQGLPDIVYAEIVLTKLYDPASKKEVIEHPEEE